MHVRRVQCVHTSGVFCVQHELNTAYTGVYSRIQAGFDKFKHTYLCSLNTQRFQGYRCKFYIALFAWRVT